jgi:hypothetical protein
MIAYLIYKDKGNSDRKRIRYILKRFLSGSKDSSGRVYDLHLPGWQVLKCALASVR